MWGSGELQTSIHCGRLPISTVKGETYCRCPYAWPFGRTKDGFDHCDICRRARLYKYTTCHSGHEPKTRPRCISGCFASSIMPFKHSILSPDLSPSPLGQSLHAAIYMPLAKHHASTCTALPAPCVTPTMALCASSDADPMACPPTSCRSERARSPTPPRRPLLQQHSLPHLRHLRSVRIWEVPDCLDGTHYNSVCCFDYGKCKDQQQGH